MTDKIEELNNEFSSKNDVGLSEILHNLHCRQVLGSFIDNQLLSIDEFFTSVPLGCDEVIVSLVKLCGNGLVKAVIADPHIFFGLDLCSHKELQELLLKSASTL